MKHCLVTLAALMVAASSYAQGTINFVNRITGTLDARVLYAGAGAGGGGAVGSDFVAQLYAGPAGGALAPVGDPIAFRAAGTAGAGYWAAAARTVPGVAENGTASAKVVVWSQSLGSSYAAVNPGGAKSGPGFAESDVISVATGGGLNPPGAMTALTGFTVPTIPEPSIAALGLLGAGLLVIRRKK